LRITTIGENQKVLFALFFAIVDWSLLGWWLLPYLLTTIDWKEFWPGYSVGFAFSAIVGGTMVGRFVGNINE